MRTPSVAGILSRSEVEATADSIESLQVPTGMIPWFPGGHADPWNHVEAAMALSTAGRHQAAVAAYQWLVDTQLDDGSWHNYYQYRDGQTVTEDDKIDTNVVAYLATGVWHHWLATQDRGFVDQMFGPVEAAIDFVLGLQTPRGEVIWARRPDELAWDYALLTGSSSISHSLACAIKLARLTGVEPTRWIEARNRLVDVIAFQPEVFAPKDRWAMDWYYPVLSGAVTGDDALKRMMTGWDDFVLVGKGVRCVSDRPWVTAAETAEAVIALVAVNETEKAHQLMGWIQALRDRDGAYFTGMVYPERVQFPEAERSSYTAAAVILAADALEGVNPTSALFGASQNP